MPRLDMTRQYAKPPWLIVAVAMIAALYGWTIFLTTFHYPGLIGPNYNTPGTDYMVFHGGIRTALAGDWPLLFDADRFTDFLNRQYHARLAFSLTYRPWVYPPSFLVLLLPFAPFAFLPSYLLFQFVTAAALAISLRAGSVRPAQTSLLAVAALIAPAASVNVLWGQGAFLTAAILIGGTRLLLGRHGILAGILFGLLSVKPQHALLIPVMLIALRAWPAILAACCTSLALAASSALIFGLEPWRLWMTTATNFVRNVPNWDNSIHTCAVLLGASPTLANIVMLAAYFAAAALVYWAFRRPAAVPLQLAILLAASNIAAPHTGPYDTMLLVLAAGLVLSDETWPKQPLAWTLGLVLWLLPFLGQPLISPVARLTPLLIAVLLVWLCRLLATMRRHITI